MTTDLRDHLHGLVDGVQPGPAPIAALLSGRRRSRRTPWLAAAAVLLVVGGGLTAGRPWGDDPSPVPPRRTPSSSPATAPGWQRVADGPLSARYGAFGVWTGHEALFVGGLDADQIGGPFRPATMRDGAAFDPATGSWRRIAPAPEPLGFALSHTWAGSTLVVSSPDGDLLAYDLDHDRWGRLPAPPMAVSQPSLASDGTRLYVLDVYVDESAAPVQVLDLGSRTWTMLPASPYTPVLDQRTLVWTPAGLVVMGDDLHPRQAGARHETARAEAWDGRRWRRYPDSRVMGMGWHWTGERIVSGYRVTRADSARGPRHRYVAGALDPVTGVWSRLPWLPAGARDEVVYWAAAADGPLLVADGFLYDDATGASTAVPVPAPGRGGYATYVVGDGWLVGFGGYSVDPGQDPGRVADVTPQRQAWAWRLPD